MAVYKIFPEQDTFIYTQVVTGNAGYDEILEIGGYNIQNIGQSSRALIQFKTSEIRNTVNRTIATGSWSASLDLSLASGYENPATQSIYVYPIAQQWEGGVGKFGDELGASLTSQSADKSGCSWRYRKAEETDAWTLTSFPTDVTGSYSATYPGGGSWFSASNGTSLEATQSFGLNDELDLSVDITTAAKLHYSGTLNNYGYIIKLQDSLEFNLSASLLNKYYSGNTNTIYPPSLTFKWDDSSYDTGSLTLLSSSEAICQVSNNRGEYADIGKTRFRLLARPIAPTRIFTTGSIYKTNYALPSGSYYGLQDAYTEEMEIPFDTSFTKISCDSTGPYFDVYMSGLQPERYYKILIKSTLDGTTSVFDDDNIFKVVRNG
tara:strand:- start:2511 stop:3641 length:1131 start_codon:yes stop_codon:yes gene_type:complete